MVGKEKNVDAIHLPPVIISDYIEVRPIVTAVTFQNIHTSVTAFLKDVEV